MTFLSQTVINGLLLGGVYVSIAIGLSLVFGVVDIINVAQGEFVMLGAFAVYGLYAIWGLSPYVGSLIVFVVFFFVGCALQKGVINRVVEAPTLMSLALLFGFSIMIRNGALFALSADRRTIETSLSGEFLEAGGLYIPIPRLVALGISISCIVALFIFLNNTKLGTAILATSQDVQAARLMGVNTKKIYNFTFGLGIALTGLGGGLIASFRATFPTMGIQYTLFAFFVVVLGGLGYIPGALYGGLVLGLTQSFITSYISSRYVYTFSFLLLYLLLIARPQGLFGKGST